MPTLLSKFAVLMLMPFPTVLPETVLLANPVMVIAPLEPRWPSMKMASAAEVIFVLPLKFRRTVPGVAVLALVTSKALPVLAPLQVLFCASTVSVKLPSLLMSMPSTPELAMILSLISTVPAAMVEL